MPENAVDYTKDVCDFCERVYEVGKDPHVCEKTPIERLLSPTQYTDYDTLVSCFGAIVVSVSDDDWQGDTRYLLRGHDGRWGVLVNGWGSCSGCDALQACSSPGDYDQLRTDLGAGTQWFDTAAACATYLTGKDWETHHSWREHETKRFVEEALDALGVSPTGGTE